MRLDTTRAAPSGNAAHISLPLLRLVNEARNEHGMRQHDYERYRHFCTKKAHRLRQTLNLTHKDEKHGAPPATTGKGGQKKQQSKRGKKKQTAVTQSAADKAKGGNVFTEKTIDVAAMISDRPAQLLLFEAERAWAHSQDLRSQSNTQGEDPALRKRGLGRARKAVQWSQQLASLAESLGSSRVDVRSRSEIAAYTLTIKASHFFDKGDWQAALQHLCVARNLLAALARSSPDSRSEALANSFVDAGEAQMRFCAYQLGEDEQDMDVVTRKTVDGVDADKVCPDYSILIKSLNETANKVGDSKEDAVQIEWRDRVVPVRNPELVDAVQRARKEEASLKEHGVGAATSESTGRRDRTDRKPQRLSHAERNARKRGQAAPANNGESSGSSRAAAAASSRSTKDPFDGALAALTDGEAVARRLVDDNAEALAKSHSTRYERVGEDLRVAHEWLRYRLLALQVRRSARLAEQVEEKARKREERKERQQSGTLAPKAKSSGSSKPRREVSKKEPRKPQPGSLAKRPRASPRASKRRPACIGAKKQRLERQRSQIARRQLVSEGQSRRHVARTIPALAKLHDTCEAALISLSGLSIVESDPDASTVIDAKLAWYRAEMLRHLGRAHSLAGKRDEACLLLRRAGLSLRQARQAADLVEDQEVAKEMDADVPPAMSEETFSRGEALVQDELKRTQREMWALEHGAAKGAVPPAAMSLTQSKAGQQLRSLALRHVDFDPVDVQEASRVDEIWQEEFARGSVAKKGPSAAVAASGARKHSVVSATGEEEDDFHEAEQLELHDEEETEEDEEFAPAAEAGEEDDEGEDEQPAKKSGGGWLGGWFRK
ncbi:hypothetical protein BDZ90DRAFT_252247 [Jaminaea rosea]|uniref:Signal recognition particle subunit SRP68 n=1 Tax=Jaminaea rosea TaxID=1569628 RepID=A0A316UX94_9BASI|nr:hypothetical protein BDZ90DRAFT_252247 [Jaminaea rosea]PWN27755.1 hypothetical protein BDZ90DRAFT_252247 [Jaminaea rosea]